MTAACGLLEAELALDRVEAELAMELAGHMRALARGEVAQPPPAVMRPSTWRVVQNALPHPLLAERAWSLARVVVPFAIESDPRVAPLRAAEPTWDAYAQLASMRETVARDRFGAGFLEIMHRVFGVARHASHAPHANEWPAPIDGWLEPDRSAAIDVEARWREIAARHGVQGRVTVRTGERARTFVIEPLREIVVVVPRELDRPASRFLALHELGHALVGLVAPPGVPRVLDEAAAALVARAIEQPADPWYSPLAARARERRTRLAQALAAIEQGISAATPTSMSAASMTASSMSASSMSASRTASMAAAMAHARPTEKPPWALWHDPAAQAAYVEAEAIADRWSSDEAPLASKIAEERARIDAAP